MSKKQENAVKALRYAGSVLAVLDTFVDVDRLIGISNAQGPIGKQVRDILLTSTSGLDNIPDETLEDLAKQTNTAFKELPPAQKRARQATLKRRKKKPSSSNSPK